MKSKTIPFLALLSVLTYNIILLASAGAPPTSTLPPYGTAERAGHVLQCLLDLIWRITPYIMLAFLALAGLKWLASGEERKERLMAKKYIEMALIGFACVAGLVGAATMLGYPPKDCVTGVQVIHDWQPAGNRGLVSPDDGSTATKNNGPTT